MIAQKKGSLLWFQHFSLSKFVLKLNPKSNSIRGVAFVTWLSHERPHCG
jgi:hypothetical protein